MSSLRTTSLRAIACVALASTCGLALTACGSSAAVKSDDAAPTLPAVAVKGVRISADPKLTAGLPDAVKKAGKVRVATDLPYPPFEMYVAEGSKEMTGIDYDLGQAIAARLGTKFEFAGQKFDGLIPAVQAGKFDAVMSAMTDKKEREQAVDFVDYINAGPGWLVKKGNPDNIKVVTDVCGKSVSVQTGTNHQKILDQRQELCKQQGKPPINVLAFPKDSEAQLALRSGKVSADFLDEVTAAYVADTADGGVTFETVVGKTAVGPTSASPIGIGVSKSVPGLKESIQAALQSLMDDGSYGKILAAYHVPDIAIPKATVNGALD
ncbi:ABC transporter substrate-binding protein [Streptomyces sp. TLI_171]|uniref:ABC transporter substrate-binding protein n=1 Tax=Streptomyces sp. TLI_171 TaxID=1938859 RepID=UPI000C18C505|nr:ABC transporter substrate-binding protein [Streptomyces sp. TLI_171]RKE23579.1 amino acid ABC transporter substrate-binding protein (PAAT family) [Streptomyces sp. TLI_171]